MSDPRNVAHAKKVTQEKKHQGTGTRTEGVPAAQPGKKPPAARMKTLPGESAAVSDPSAASESAVTGGSPLPKTPAMLEASLAVLAKLKDMDFHSRGTLERLAELMLTVEDELKQTELANPLGEVFSAQDAFQTKLTALIEAYKAECGRLQNESA